MNYLYRYRWWMSLFSPYLIWRIPTRKKEVFLTFDDGPSADVTAKVLELLRQHDAKATFFCLGKNVAYHPDLFSQIKEEGHEVGNHTFHHISGWNTSTERYIGSINKAESVFGGAFFRPPYGKITWQQIAHIKKRFKLIMWTVLSGDFDNSIPISEILINLKTNLKKGNIIVFHDNAKSASRLLEILPEYLMFLKQEGYQCSVLRAPRKWYQFWK